MPNKKKQKTTPEVINEMADMAIDSQFKKEAEKSNFTNQPCCEKCTTKNTSDCLNNECVCHNQPYKLLGFWQEKLLEGIKCNVPSDTQLWILETVSELLQKQKDEDVKDADAMFENGYDAGYNYARKEMKQWAEEKVGENHDKLLQELLEELK